MNSFISPFLKNCYNYFSLVKEVQTCYIILVFAFSCDYYTTTFAAMKSNNFIPEKGVIVMKKVQG